MAGQVLERPVDCLEGRIEMLRGRIGENHVGDSDPKVAVFGFAGLYDIKGKETGPPIASHRGSDEHRRNDLVRDKVKK